MISNIVERYRGVKQKTPGRRLFSYLREVRCVRDEPPMNPGDCFRASSLGYECFREVALASKYEIIRQKHIRQGLQITFDIGDIFHRLYREYYFGPMQEWAGAWECLYCGWDTDKVGLSVAPTCTNGIAKQGKVARMPLTCGGCGAPFISEDGSPSEASYVRFKEWHIEDKVICLDGHPDGWSIIPASARRVTDLKSQTSNTFAGRRSAEPEHVAQVMGYMHLCGDKIGSVWYLNKSPWGDSPSFLRDFDFTFDRKIFRKLVVEPLNVLQNSLAGGSLPERGCVTRDCPRANECQLADICFEG